MLPTQMKLKYVCRRLLFIFELGIFFGAACSINASETKSNEKHLCAYYEKPSVNESFSVDCDSYCAKYNRIGKDPSCFKMPLTILSNDNETKETAWQVFVKRCREGGFTHCYYTGHGNGYPTDGVMGGAISVGKACLNSSKCESYTSSSCFGISDTQIPYFLRDLKWSAMVEQYPKLKKGEKKVIKVEQNFAGSYPFDPQGVWSTQLQFALFQDSKKSCKVTASLPKCSSFDPNPITGTNPGCYAHGQTYMCRSEVNGKHIVKQEVCCGHDSNSRRWELCKNTSLDPEKPNFVCSCKEPTCDELIGTAQNPVQTACDGYLGREDRRARVPLSCYDKFNNRYKALCCRNKERGHEDYYGHRTGIIRPVEECNVEEVLGRAVSNILDSSDKLIKHIENLKNKTYSKEH